MRKARAKIGKLKLLESSQKWEIKALAEEPNNAILCWKREGSFASHWRPQEDTVPDNTKFNEMEDKGGREGCFSAI